MSNPKDTALLIRLERATKEMVDEYTDNLGISVSAWIRMLVIQELQRAGRRVA